MKLVYVVVPPLVITLLPTPTSNMAALDQRFLLQRDTGIVDSGATHLYIAPTAPHVPPNTSAPQISVGTATVHVDRLSVTASLPIPQLVENFPTTGYITPSFNNILVGVRPICNADCIVLFYKKNVTVFSPEGNTILTGWIEKEISKLWRFALRPNKDLPLHQNPESNKTTILAYSAYDIPSVEALVRYMHAASGFPVKSMWLREIKRGDFEMWPGLT